jgi:hypothetical protein
MLYKRPKANCEVHKTKLSETAERFYWECACPLWITDLLPDGPALDRQTTGASDLEAAEAIRNALIAKHSARIWANNSAKYK